MARKKETDILFLCFSLFLCIYGIILFIALTLHFFSRNKLFWRFLPSLFNNVFLRSSLYFVVQMCRNSFHQYLTDGHTEFASVFCFCFCFYFKGEWVFKAIVQFKITYCTFQFQVWANVTQ